MWWQRIWSTEEAHMLKNTPGDCFKISQNESQRKLLVGNDRICLITQHSNHMLYINFQDTGQRGSGLRWCIDTPLTVLHHVWVRRECSAFKASENNWAQLMYVQPVQWGIGLDFLKLSSAAPFPAFITNFRDRALVITVNGTLPSISGESHTYLDMSWMLKVSKAM